MIVSSQAELDALSASTQMQAFSSVPAWCSFLAFAGKHYKQPLHNILAIRGQFPTAQAVADFAFWKKHGHSIRRGEKGIRIYAQTPNGIYARMFDVAQTVNGSHTVERLRWMYSTQQEEKIVQALHIPEVTYSALTAAILTPLYDMNEPIPSHLFSSFPDVWHDNLRVWAMNTIAESAAYCICSRLDLDLDAITTSPNTMKHFKSLSFELKTYIAQQMMQLSHTWLRTIEKELKNDTRTFQPDRQPVEISHDTDRSQDLQRNARNIGGERTDLLPLHPAGRDTDLGREGQHVESGSGGTEPSDLSSDDHVVLNAAPLILPPHQIIAQALMPMLQEGFPIASKDLTSAANSAYGGTQAQGAYTIKDAYDALEYTVNQYLLTVSSDWNQANPSEHLDFLEQLLQRLPTQTRRTPEMEELQQYSTPPTIAYLAARAANIQPNDVVLEPSAGIGGLAIYAKAWGADFVYVNELSSNRVALLKDFGFNYLYQENAEQLDNILPEDVQPSVILMNPPFSSSAGRMRNNKTVYGIQHIEQALARLADGGRLVAILGNSMSDNTPARKDWWERTKMRYNVIANLQIDGYNYRKYGTTYDVQIVVIDKTGSTTQPTITGSYKDLQDALLVLEGIRHGRHQPIRSNPEYQQLSLGTSFDERIRSDGQQSLISGAEHGVSDQPDRKRRSRVRNGAQSGTAIEPLQPTTTVGTQSTMVSQRDGRTPDRMPGLGRQLGSDVGTTERLLSDGARTADSASRNHSSESGSDWLRFRAEPTLPLTAIHDIGDDGVYSAYIPQKVHIADACPHPAQLVESAAMAAVAPPDATYIPRLENRLVSSGALSEAQLENIVYAGQSHSQVLPDGKRRGYFIGDGTGVGKGRQVCGIIMDNMNQGRTKAIWISKNKSLLDDAIRDWTDLGGDKHDVLDLSKIGYKDIVATRGILFSTYDTIKSKSRAGADHISQIKSWLGASFDGVIVFDEAHAMANALDSRGARGTQKASSKALAGIALQDELPDARIVYASATGATDIKDYAYLTRLGLWGQGTAFHDVRDFISKISAGGIAAMELTARDMKSMGVYMARSISFEGVEYDTLQHNLNPMQKEIYDTMSRAWQTVLQNLDDVLQLTRAHLNIQQSSSARSQFYGALQRFYNQVLTSMMMPSVISSIKDELAANHSCVLQLVNTNQAAADRSISAAQEKGESLEDLDMTPSDTLVQYLMNSFPVHQYEEYMDDKENLRSRLVVDSQGKAVINKEALTMRDALIERIREMKVPEGALEMLFDAFGVEQVAEVTGRNRRLVPKVSDDGNIHRVLERRTPRHAAADVQAFQDGKKRILVFSDAGGTGKSYHADRRARNQQKRIHYLLQPGWNASAATQGFGRTHRSNQAETPTFRLCTTDIMGQKRFTSTIARRLDQLGALTKGQRQTGSGMFGEKDNLESYLARDTLERFYRSLTMNNVEGVPDGIGVLTRMGLKKKLLNGQNSFYDKSDVTRNMGIFLNRILALEVDEQNAVFGAFYNRFERAFDDALAADQLDIGLENIQVEKIEVEEETVIHTDDLSGATTIYLKLKTFEKTKLLGLEAVQHKHHDFRGLYRYRDGTVRAVFRLADKTDHKIGKIEEQYKIQAPADNQYSIYNKNSVDIRLRRLPESDWADAWQAETAKMPEYLEKTRHLLSGTLLPVWNRLPEDNTRVMRIQSTDGKRFLGRIIPENQIDLVLGRFHVKREASIFTPEGIMNGVLSSGKAAVLEREHIVLIRSRVNGENRIEITGDNLWWLERQYNIICETIAFHKRYFIPTGEKGEAVLEKILFENPLRMLRNLDNSHCPECDMADEEDLDEDCELG